MLNWTGNPDKTHLLKPNQNRPCNSNKAKIEKFGKAGLCLFAFVGIYPVSCLFKTSCGQYGFAEFRLYPLFRPRATIAESTG